MDEGRVESSDTFGRIFLRSHASKWAVRFGSARCDTLRASWEETLDRRRLGRGT